MHISRSITPTQLERLRDDVDNVLRRGDAIRRHSLELAGDVQSDRRLIPALRELDEPKMS